MAEVVLLDGGMGQELVKRSGDAPTPQWATQVMIDHPGLVADIHRDYAAAGATVATVNSYAAHHDRFVGTALEGKVTEIEQRNGNIISVSAGADKYSADFFIDCSGFKGLLIESLKQDNWHDLSPYLPCNKAVVMQVAYGEDEVPRTYTQATALNYGWAWQIDLVNRRGSGYVYDSTKVTAQQAEQELLNHLGTENKILGTALQCNHK